METSSFDCNRCNPLQSTDCVQYTGPAIPCLNLCKGDNLTKMQWVIANQICALVEATNLSTLVIPTCLVDAWEDQDVTILNLFKFILNQLCQVQTDIDTINNTLGSFDPQITLNDTCLGSVCITNNTLHLSEHLQNLINEICDLKATILELNDEITTLNSFNTNVQNQINNLTSRVDTLNSILISGPDPLTTRVACIEERISHDPDIPSSC